MRRADAGVGSSNDTQVVFHGTCVQQLSPAIVALRLAGEVIRRDFVRCEFKVWCICGLLLLLLLLLVVLLVSVLLVCILLLLLLLLLLEYTYFFHFHVISTKGTQSISDCSFLGLGRGSGSRGGGTRKHSVAKREIVLRQRPAYHTKQKQRR